MCTGRTVPIVSTPPGYMLTRVRYTRVCSSVQDNSFQPGPVAYQLIKCLIISIHFIIYTLLIYHLYGVQLKGKGIRCPSPFR